MNKKKFTTFALKDGALRRKRKRWRPLKGLYKQKLMFSSSETTREDIRDSEQWAIGLIEGDGHIGLEWTNATQNKWVPVLKVTLHCYNARAIYKLKQILSVGKITRSKNTISLRVRTREAWKTKLIPLFDRFTLRTSKYYDFLVVKYALKWHDYYKQNSAKSLALVRANRSFYTFGNFCKNKIEAFKKMLEIKTKPLGPLGGQHTNKFTKPLGPLGGQHTNKLSPAWDCLIDHHTDVTPCFSRPFDKQSLKLLINHLNNNTTRKEILRSIINPGWLAGFIEAEGSFYILSKGQHGFALGQTNDIIIPIAMHCLFEINAQLKIRDSYVMLDTKNTQSLYLIASFVNHKLLGLKSFIFSVWLRTLRKKVTTKSIKARAIIAKIRKTCI
jgi:hypothetical protein